MNSIKKEIKNNSITIRCTDEEKNKIVQYADKEGMKCTEYIISKCIPEKEKLIKDNNDKRKELICLRNRQGFINKLNRKLDMSSSMDYKSFINDLKEILKEEEGDIHACVENFGKTTEEL